MKKRKSEMDEDQMKKKMKVEHADMEIEGKSNKKKNTTLLIFLQVQD